VHKQRCRGQRSRAAHTHSTMEDPVAACPRVLLVYVSKEHLRDNLSSTRKEPPLLLCVGTSSTPTKHTQMMQVLFLPLHMPCNTIGLPTRDSTRCLLVLTTTPQAWMYPGP
jgi:hypothetical protein